MHFPSFILLAASTQAVFVQRPFGGVRDLTQQHASTLAELDGELRMIQLSEHEAPRPMLDSDKEALRRAGIRFMDVTDHRSLGQQNALAASSKKGKLPAFPKKLAQSQVVRKLIPDLSQQKMKRNLEIFSGFHSRYYKSKYGAASGEYLFNLVQNVTSTHAGIKVTQFKHPWGQHSVIATLKGETDQVVVVGAHQDSANLFLPSLLPAPGADDDGSGTVTILEVLRVLAKSGFKPKNTLVFAWFSAEEGGLLGSQAYFDHCEKTGVNVIAMLQQDMTGFIQKTLDAGLPESVGVIIDFVDPDLTNFIKLVVTGYCDIPYVETKCGYACSDHASATKAGYRSAFVIEAAFSESNNHIHTQQDVINKLDFGHMRQHAILTLGYAVEAAAM
jgi:leucyl aminopeptidase